jgi:hypothetical protein
MGIKFLGVEEIIKSVNPVLIDKKTLKKQTTWVNENGDLDSINFNDTYELYKVDGSYFSEGLPSWRTVNDVYYVKCKDTSTDREYFIWVDIRSVADTNDVNRNEVNAIQAIAWTIQTNIEKGGIERIVRQGDCILIKPTAKAKSDSVRHLTEKEYKTLLIAES